jgi:hypothetical protein
MRVNAVRSESFVGRWFGVLPPFAHLGVPVTSIITRIPCALACWMMSSRSASR